MVSRAILIAFVVAAAALPAHGSSDGYARGALQNIFSLVTNTVPNVIPAEVVPEKAGEFAGKVGQAFTEAFEALEDVKGCVGNVLALAQASGTCSFDSMMEENSFRLAQSQEAFDAMCSVDCRTTISELGNCFDSESSKHVEAPEAMGMMSKLAPMTEEICRTCAYHDQACIESVEAKFRAALPSAAESVDGATAADRQQAHETLMEVNEVYRALMAVESCVKESAETATECPTMMRMTGMESNNNTSGYPESKEEFEAACSMECMAAYAALANCVSPAMNSIMSMKDTTGQERPELEKQMANMMNLEPLLSEMCSTCAWNDHECLDSVNAKYTMDTMEDYAYYYMYDEDY